MRNQHSGDGIEPVKCEPKGRFSGDYVLDWGGETIDVLFEDHGREGVIVQSGEEYEIHSKGPLGKTWTLEKDRECVMTATRHGVRSSIRLLRDNEAFLLERKHLLSPVFLLSDNEGIVAEYAKQGILHRKLDIGVINAETDFPLLAFAFWLVVSVRRASTGSLKA